MSSILTYGSWHLLIIHIPFEWSNFPWLCLDSFIVCSLTLKLFALIQQRRSYINYGFHSIRVNRGSKEFVSTLLCICSRGLITTQIVMFHTLNTLGFEHFLRSNQPNLPSWHVKDLAMLLIKFYGKFGCF